MAQFDKTKFEMMEEIRKFFTEKGEDVLTVKSGTLCIPVTEDNEEGYINITIAVPKGERISKYEGGGYVPYDGYAEAENYKVELAEKAKKKAEAEAKKQAKMAKDKAAKAKEKEGE